MAERLTHIDEAGSARMVDIAAKPTSKRMAVARAFVRMRPETAGLIRDRAIPKGDVLAAARIAGIMAAKQTSNLIPLTHPLAITNATVDLDTTSDGIAIEATVQCVEKTGVEMEALTAASIAALTIYDMCKAVDRGMTIENVRLVRKEGGKSGTYVREGESG